MVVFANSMCRIWNAKSVLQVLRWPRFKGVPWGQLHMPVPLRYGPQCQEWAPVSSSLVKVNRFREKQNMWWLYISWSFSPFVLERWLPHSKKEKKKKKELSKSIFSSINYMRTHFLLFFTASVVIINYSIIQLFIHY